MTTWRIEPVIDEPDLRMDRRRGVVRVLAVAVASLLMANGVILAEHYAQRDLLSLMSDGMRDVRGALSRMLDPNDDHQVQAGVEDTTTSTTGAGSAQGDPASQDPTGTTATTAGTAATTQTTGSAAGGPASTAPPSTTGPGAVPAGNPFESAVPALSAFVEKERSLRFRSPVMVTTLDDAAFRARLNERRLGPAEAEARHLQGVMRALGLIEPGVDLAAQVRRLSTGSVSVFYDTAANELLVRNVDVTPFVRKVLVHELTKALDDQHFELDRPSLRSPGNEAGDAFEAIVEGIATRVEERYVASLPASDRQAVEAEQRRLAAQIPRDLPRYVLVSFGFPFTAGLRIANALAEAGGQTRLNAALSAPPSTTEQVLRPEKFMAGEAPRAVGTPPADGPVTAEGSLGQLNLSLMLAEVLEGGYAEAAADGWGGDRYVAWEQGGQTCVRLVVDMDNAEENGELAEGLADWASDTPGAVVEGTGPFTVTRCG